MASNGNEPNGGTSGGGRTPQSTSSIPHSRMQEMQTQSTEKLTESSSLSPNNNQTYFAEEKIPIPEIEGVSCLKIE